MKRAAQREHVGWASALPDSERLAGLRDLYPEAFAEGKVDFDKLRGLLGGEIDERPERYSFTWAGKRDAIRLLQAPSRAALIPCPEESIRFEQTGHVFIEGENLEALKLLYKAYFGRVKMIYIDPPYNTGHDFIYPDNYADPLATYLQLTGQQDAVGNLLTSNPETSGRYHSAWLSMMYPRLFLARQLLREDGVIFVSIDDTEVANLRLLMNEIFGEENFVSNIIWEKKFSPQNDDMYIAAAHDHILLYARSMESWRPSLLPRSEKANIRYQNPDNDPRGPWSSGDLTTKTKAKGHSYPITSPTGKVFYPTTGRQWGLALETFQKLSADNRIWFGATENNIPRVKQFLSEVQKGIVPISIWKHTDVGHNQEAKQELNSIFKDAPLDFETPKPSRLIKRMLQIAASENGSIVLDFFAGTCTTAQAVLEFNREDGGDRRFIMVQLPEPTGNKQYPTIAEIGKERIRRVLAKLKSENAGQLSLPSPAQLEDLGFRVFKMAPSAFKPWVGEAAEPEAYARQLELQTDPLVEGWKPQDVIWEVALREGFGLDAQVVPVAGLEARAIWRVTDPAREQSFVICLADRIDLAAVRPLNLGREDLFICRDAALDDEAAANLALQCRLKTI
jgi:adenine-specific DNA-methyltransferase